METIMAGGRIAIPERDRIRLMRLADTVGTGDGVYGNCYKHLAGLSEKLGLRLSHQTWLNATKPGYVMNPGSRRKLLAALDKIEPMFILSRSPAPMAYENLSSYEKLKISWPGIRDEAAVAIATIIDLARQRS